MACLPSSSSLGCQTAIYANNARRQHVALITVATVARKMLQQLFFYDAATTSAAAVAAKTLTVNCGMPSLLDLMSVHFVRLKHVHEAVKGGRKRREYIHV